MCVCLRVLLKWQGIETHNLATTPADDDDDDFDSLCVRPVLIQIDFW